MRRAAKWAVALGAAGAIAVGGWASTASAITTAENFHLHEQDTGNAFIDLGAKGPSLGDELLGASTLTTPGGAAAGTDSFVCTSVASNDSTFQCTVVYSLRRGRVTAQGTATITGTHPLFDELFAVTGGTRAYQNARGQVRILQSTQTHAELYFHLLP
jgi:hypothetical protein